DRDTDRVAVQHRPRHRGGRVRRDDHIRHRRLGGASAGNTSAHVCPGRIRLAAPVQQVLQGSNEFGDVVPHHRGHVRRTRTSRPAACAARTSTPCLASSSAGIPTEAACRSVVYSRPEPPRPPFRPHGRVDWLTPAAVFGQFRTLRPPRRSMITLGLIISAPPGHPVTRRNATSTWCTPPVTGSYQRATSPSTSNRRPPHSTRSPASRSRSTPGAVYSVHPVATRFRVDVVVSAWERGWMLTPLIVVRVACSQSGTGLLYRSRPRPGRTLVTV